MSVNPPNGPQYGSNPNEPQYPQDPAGSYPPPGNYPPPSNYPSPGNYPPPPTAGNSAYGAGSQLPGGVEPGGLGFRLLARLIDSVIVGIVSALIWLVSPDGFVSTLIFGLVTGLLGIAYFTFMESTRGQTIGKKLLGLRTLGAAGGNPTQAEAIKRNAFMLLNLVPWIGGLLMFVAYIVIGVTINSSPSNQGKHDEFAGGTRVVKA